ncbi:hypothetical protein FRACYDRAFT_253497 [Fragilariopsis cylindrus CCMP1102]|uniref:Uncharacterized protein n=1 Tax=Fragilariopsis cylindrus CCMP1102 TaxID=635003 RepID=A0A1E7ELJ8_9STRA|nr:hypothetical protein FRACYDRAFT_253497 [Fragilariopsis cylindrus CCMP1102]|eukprot:OEU06737.1 hypothetical protein FRACYDRAFT_253497 [Fragilariopsis cylindrus CCMP1102]
MVDDDAIISSFVLKITTSIDDLLWLSPFLSLSTAVISASSNNSSRSSSGGLSRSRSRSKIKYSAVYFCICICVTMISYVFGTSLLSLANKLTSGEDNDNNDGYHYWNVERILSIFSFLVLLIFARKDYIEWKGGEEENNNNGNGTTATSASASFRISTNSFDDYNNDRNDGRTTYDIEDSNNHENDNNDNEDINNNAENNATNVNEIRNEIDDDDASKSEIRRFIIVCIMGTFDDMIVFSAFVAGSSSSSSSSSNSTSTVDTKKTTNINNFIELFLGTTFAALIIILLAWGCSEIYCFQQFITKIPMWLLMTGIAFYILIMGLL